MKKLFLLLGAAFGFTSCIQAQDVSLKLDSLMKYYASEYNFNGVALVAQHGKVIYEKAFGYKDMTSKKPHTEQDIFQVGTLTTQFTAEVILQYAAEHKLNLDDKLKKYLPDYPKGDSLTIDNLLTHTSGVFDYMIMEPYTMRHDSVSVAKDSLLRLFQNRSLSGKPGTKFRYSNSNYLLLGYVIESIAHKSYWDVVRERILIPAGMTHSGFDFRGLKDTNKAVPYRYYDVVSPVKQSAYDSTLMGGAGALYSTAADLYKWDKILQSGKLLNNEWQQKAYTYQNKYARSWVTDTVGDKMVLGLAGITQGFSSYFSRIIDDSTCIILLENVKFPAFDNRSVTASIVSCVEDKDYRVPVPQPAIYVSPADLKKYEGVFIFGSSAELTIRYENGGLHGSSPNGIDYDLVPIGRNTFKTSSLHATLEFIAGPDGVASKLIIHEALRKHDATGIRKQPKK